MLQKKKEGVLLEPFKQKTIPLKNNNGYLSINYIEDRTKPCFSVQHFLDQKTPGHLQVTFTDDPSELQSLINNMYEKYSNINLSSKAIQQKIRYESLILEITRRCNMKCKHCLRGDSEQKDMSYEIAKAALDSAESIGNITLTGGEPTLNIELMLWILNYSKQIQLPIENFYIVTNGKEVSDQFLQLLMDYWVYVNQFNSEEIYSGIALSRDTYHESIPTENMIKLKGLSFYKDDKDCITYPRSIINMGRAKTLNADKIERSITQNIETEKIDDTILIYGDIYITVNGDILSDCDLSYDIMKDNTHGNILNYETFLQTLNNMEDN